MNVNVLLPNIVPNTYQPQVESALRDNIQRERVIEPRAVESYPRYSERDTPKQNTREQVVYQRHELTSRGETSGADAAGMVEAKAEQQNQEAEQQNADEQNTAAQGERQSASGSDSEELTPDEHQQVQELVARDTEVRAHEQAHAAAGGQWAGAPSYDYQRGPDGKRYAVGGEVPIDVSSVAGDPRATIAKMQQVRRAALAPAQPSPTDRRVAAEATLKINRAFMDLSNQREGEGEVAGAGRRRLGGFSASEEQNEVSVTNKNYPQNVPTLSEAALKTQQVIVNRYFGGVEAPSNSNLSLQA